MALTYKVLGQLNPAATTYTALYTTPAITQTIISSITICNQAGTSGTFRISIQPNDEARAAKHFIDYDTAIAANTQVVRQIGITLDPADVIYVYASSASISFNAFGVQIV